MTHRYSPLTDANIGEYLYLFTVTAVWNTGETGDIYTLPQYCFTQTDRKRDC